MKHLQTLKNPAEAGFQNFKNELVIIHPSISLVEVGSFSRDQIHGFFRGIDFLLFTGIGLPSSLLKA